LESEEGVVYKVFRRGFTGSTGTYTYSHAHTDFCTPRQQHRDLTWNIVIDFPKGVEEGWCAAVLSAGTPEARRTRQIVDSRRVRGDLVGERMRSDVSRSGIVIDILVKWVALTFCCQIESVLGVFWTVSVFLTRHGEGFSKQPKHRKHATRLVVSDSDRDNIHFRAKAVSRGEKLELRLLSKA
jgi:hypothetical protein